MTYTPTDAEIEATCRAMLAESRPSSNPDQLTAGVRGQTGLIPTWRIYERLAIPGLIAAHEAREATTAAHEPSEEAVDDVSRAILAAGLLISLPILLRSIQNYKRKGEK